MSTPTEISRARAIPPLTSLRFVAAFGIVLHHSRGVLLPKDFLDGYPLDAGVIFFFVLSGFILTYVNADAMNVASRLDLRSFYAARLARIWPAVVGSVVVMLVIVPTSKYLPFYRLHHDPLLTVSSFASYVTMTQAWVPVPAYYFGYNAVAWSVSVEMAFYLAFPFLLRSLYRNWRAKYVGVFAIGLVLPLLADLFALPSFGSVALNHVDATAFSYINPLVRLKEFFTGMVLAVLFLRLRHRRFDRRTASAAEALALAAAVTLVPWTGTRIYRGLSGSPAVGQYLEEWIVGLLFGVVILLVAFERGALSKLLSHRAGVLLGEISFSLYLFHQVLLNCYQAHPFLLAWAPSGLRFSVYLSACCLAAYVSWRWLETPLRKSLRFRLEKSRRVRRHDLGGEFVVEVEHGGPAPEARTQTAT